MLDYTLFGIRGQPKSHGLHISTISGEKGNAPTVGTWERRELLASKHTAESRAFLHQIGEFPVRPKVGDSHNGVSVLQVPVPLFVGEAESLFNDSDTSLLGAERLICRTGMTLFYTLDT